MSNRGGNHNNRNQGRGGQANFDPFRGSAGSTSNNNYNIRKNSNHNPRQHNSISAQWTNNSNGGGNGRSVFHSNGGGRGQQQNNSINGFQNNGGRNPSRGGGRSQEDGFQNNGGRNPSRGGGRSQEGGSGQSSFYNPFGSASSSVTDTLRQGQGDRGFNQNNNSNRGHFNHSNNNSSGNTFGTSNNRSGNNSGFMSRMPQQQPRMDNAMHGGRGNKGEHIAQNTSTFDPFGSSTSSSIFGSNTGGRGGRNSYAGGNNHVRHSSNQQRQRNYGGSRGYKQHAGDGQGGDDMVEMDDGSSGPAIQGGIFSRGQGAHSGFQYTASNNSIGSANNSFGSSSNSFGQDHIYSGNAFGNSNRGGDGRGGVRGKFNTGGGDCYDNQGFGMGYSQGGFTQSISGQNDQPVVVTTLNKISADDLGLDTAADNDDTLVFPEKRERYAVLRSPDINNISRIIEKTPNIGIDIAGIDVTFADADDPFSNISDRAPANCMPTFEELDKFGFVPEFAPLR